MFSALLLGLAAAQSAPAPQPQPRGQAGSASTPGTSFAPGAIHTSIVIDSNPALFAMMAAITAAGYDTTLAGSSSQTPAAKLRDALRARLQSVHAPVVAELKAFYTAHHRADPNSNLAQYITLALFLGNPPGLSLAVPAAGLPPDAASVDDIVPLVRRFYADAHLDKLWQSIQPQYDQALAQDAAQARATLTTVDAFFRIPDAYSPRQFYIFPSALVSAAQSEALNYQDNYYFVANLDLAVQMRQVRHTYLHFVLDPVIGAYPAIVAQVDKQILPTVQRAPALEPQFKHDPQLFYTECLVRAIEIQLDPGTPVSKRRAVDAAMKRGLVMTRYWFDQLTAYRADPADFAEFYPQAAFGARLDEIASSARHLTFAPAPAAAPAVADVQRVHVPGLLERGQERFDAHDLAAAASLAEAVLKQPDGDQASAWFLLGKVAAEKNQPAAAITNFNNALKHAATAQVHILTWSNLYLARLYDAEHNRPLAISHYQAALASADTPVSKSLAEAGLKSPFRPPGAAH